MLLQLKKQFYSYRHLSRQSFGEGIVHGVHLLGDVPAHDGVQQVEQVCNDSELVLLDIKTPFQELKMKCYGHRQIQVELIEALCKQNNLDEIDKNTSFGNLCET